MIEYSYNNINNEEKYNMGGISIVDLISKDRSTY